MEGEISMVDGRCYLIDHFIPHHLADRYFDRILETAQWKQQTIRLFGRNVQSPRLSAWYGDKDAVYRYSGLTNRPLPWFEELSQIRQQLQEYIGERFNSVLLNLYRNGSDSMGSHADDEPELGENPVIASLSLGETRRFILKHQRRKDLASIKMDLSHGSLLIMAGQTQRYWQHQVPKTRKAVSKRINLTYRWVEPGL